MFSEPFQAALNRAVEDAREALLVVERATSWKPRQQAKRQARQKRILPGFPRTTPFLNHAEAKAYLATTELTCLVCGKPYRLLATHLRNTHGIEPDDYRAAYGIPWTFGLAGSATAAQKSASLKGKLADPEFASTWFAYADRHRQAAHEKARHQRSQPFQRELARQHLEKAGIAIGQWQDEDFLRILDMMKANDLLLKDVAGKVEGVPPLGTAVRWFYAAPERHQRLVDTVHQLSYRCQARARMFGSRLIEDIRKLRETGKLQREIAQATGLSVMTIAKLLKRYA